MPAARRFGSDLVGGDEFLPPESVAGGGDGDAFLHGIEVSFLFEFFAEFYASSFEEFDVGLAVRFHFAPQDELVVGSDFFSIPSFKLGFFLGGHAVGIVMGSIRHGSLVVLVFQGVEFMREESLAQFLNSKGSRKVGEWEREKA